MPITLKNRTRGTVHICRHCENGHFVVTSYNYRYLGINSIFEMPPRQIAKIANIQHVTEDASMAFFATNNQPPTFLSTRTLEQVQYNKSPQKIERIHRLL
jgi:hypothetical protein